MAEERTIQMQDSQGNIYHPQTKASAVFAEDGTSLEGAAIKPASAAENNIALFDNLKNTKDSGKNIGNTSGNVLVLPTGLQAGDLFRVNSSGQVERIPKGTDGQGLILDNGLPVWGSGTGTKCVSGTYSGDGSSDRTIQLGFTPKLAAIGYSNYNGSDYGAGISFYNIDGDFFSQCSSSVSYDSYNRGTSAPLIVTNGFKVDGSNNKNGMNYNYIAIG